MEQPYQILGNGTRIITHSTLADGLGLPRGGNMRKPNQAGIIAGVVGGYGGDVYWVRHEVGEDEVAPYVYTEFELE